MFTCNTIDRFYSRVYIKDFVSFQQLTPYFKKYLLTPFIHIYGVVVAGQYIGQQTNCTVLRNYLGFLMNRNVCKLSKHFSTQPKLSKYFNV